MRRASILISFIIVVIFGALTACGPAEEATPESYPEELLLEVQHTPVPTPENPPFSRRSFTNEEVLANWGSIEHLESGHLYVETRCTECHPPPYLDPIIKPACVACHTESPREIPDDADCLACHGGTPGAISNQTNDYEPYNPHDYHYGADIACVYCHNMHEPRIDSCALCHETYEIARFDG